MTTSSVSVGVVIPVYNEAAALATILPTIPPMVDTVVIHRPVRDGPGPAIRDGIDHLLPLAAA